MATAICRSCYAEKLEENIMVNPAILAGGPPLFERAEARTDLELPDSWISDTGVVRLHCRTRT